MTEIGLRFERSGKAEFLKQAIRVLSIRRSKEKNTKQSIATTTTSTTATTITSNNTVGRAIDGTRIQPTEDRKTRVFSFLPPNQVRPTFGYRTDVKSKLIF
jgi:hypothetical protein